MRFTTRISRSNLQRVGLSFEPRMNTCDVTAEIRPRRLTTWVVETHRHHMTSVTFHIGLRGLGRTCQRAPYEFSNAVYKVGLEGRC